MSTEKLALRVTACVAARRIDVIPTAKTDQPP